MQRSKRHTELIANFVNGYAEGWYMAVKESFRNELDIKYTERSRNKQSCFEWTQGPYYSFAEGHLFYDISSGYDNWEKALKSISLCCKIISATPTELGNNKELHEGTVFFRIYKPDNNKLLKAVNDYTLSQTEFVKFLKTGSIDEREHN